MQRNDDEKQLFKQYLQFATDNEKFDCEADKTIQ